MTRRVWNFSAGPAALPEPVLQRAQQELLDGHGRGMSIMEMSHRSADFGAVMTKTESDLRALLAIPANYRVLFLQGGALGQNAAVPLNLLPADGQEFMAEHLPCFLHCDPFAPALGSEQGDRTADRARG